MRTPQKPHHLVSLPDTVTLPAVSEACDTILSVPWT